ncbi:MAG TPA: hypothetical protein VJ110_02275 [Candidatus Nanoarchaeia archaeon]|nr:hypothetical protein [Candidatus Nanoarchaeia archaeon]
MALSMNKKGVEAWWGFLAGAIIAIVVVIIVIALYLQIRAGGEASLLGIADQLSNLFK